jgi:hypothetical protein
MFDEFFSKHRGLPPVRVKKDEVQVLVNDFGVHYRLLFNFGGNIHPEVYKILTPPHEPSRLPGYEGMTAEEAYQHRKVHDRPKPGASFGWIVIPERTSIRTEEQIQWAIDAAVAEEGGLKSEANPEGRWSKVSRYDLSLEDFLQVRRRNAIFRGTGA